MKLKIKEFGKTYYLIDTEEDRIVAPCTRKSDAELIVKAVNAYKKKP